MGEENPNLTAHEFFDGYGARWHDVNQCSFYSRMGYRVVHLESYYSHVKNWDIKFFFVSRVGWEFPIGEASHNEFPIRASWCSVPDDREFALLPPGEK